MEYTHKPMFHDCEQQTELWHEIKLGKISGSTRIQKAICGLAVGKNGEPTKTSIKTRENLINVIANELITGEKSDEDSRCFETIHMARGNRCEEDARLIYSFINCVDVRECGFIERDYISGVSVDGLVGDDGILETKCPDAPKFLSLLKEFHKNGKIEVENDYYIQMQMGLYISQRQWCDYINYNERYSHIDDGVIIQRVERDENVIEKIHNALEYYKMRIDIDLKFIDSLVGNKTTEKIEFEG